MLLEDPTCLNIPAGLSSNTLIKEKILEGVIEKSSTGTLRNNLIREAVEYTESYKEAFIFWLFSIKPVFPRFLNKLYTSTYFKITESIVSIFQNSRTIRRIFSRDFSAEIVLVIKNSELGSLKSPIGDCDHEIWECSVSKADLMRKQSWGPAIVGITVPHPGEFLEERLCSELCQGPHIVSKKIPSVHRSTWTKGPYQPYLGSKTQESTSLLQPWEKTIEIPLIKRASDLRKVLDWFVDRDSNLGRAIYNNIRNLTGLDLTEVNTGFKRSGSGKHRLRCSRVSNEGNPAIGFNNLCYVTVTTDALGALNETNHDFMHQSMLIWTGVMSTLPTSPYPTKDVTHFHVTDFLCIRQIQEEVLETPLEYHFQDVSKNVRRMITTDLCLKYVPRISACQEYNWETQTTRQKSWQIGRAQGFLWGLHVYNDSTQKADSLFPITITRKVAPVDYLDGLYRGLCLGASLIPMFTRYGSLSEKARLKFEGAFWDLVDRALSDSRLVAATSHRRFEPFFQHQGSDSIKSYPATDKEISTCLRRWFLRKLIADRNNHVLWKSRDVVVFADMNTDYVTGMFRLAESILPVFQYDKLSTRGIHKLKNAKRSIYYLGEYNKMLISPEVVDRLQRIFRGRNFPRLFSVESEARHAVGSIPEPREPLLGTHTIVPTCRDVQDMGCDFVLCEYQPKGLRLPHQNPVTDLPNKTVKCPLFSGVRVAQIATGAHYKIKDLQQFLPDKGDGIFCGDGSGGLGAWYLRANLSAKVIFNSKLQIGTEGLKGLAPAGPGAYTLSGPHVTSRCVNFPSCWEDPDNLCDEATWAYFQQQISCFNLCVSVLCCDAEVVCLNDTQAIENNILRFISHQDLSSQFTLVYKIYWSYLRRSESLAQKLGFFKEVFACFPHTQSSFTSEVYIIGKGFRKSEIVPATELSSVSLLDIYSKLKVTKDIEKEFNRALNVSYDQMSSNVERYCPYNTLEEVAVFLTSLGLETGLSLFVSDILMTEIKLGLHPVLTCLILGYIITKSHLNVTAWVQSMPKFPPSSQLQKIIASVFGLWFSVSLLTEDIQAFKHVLELYQDEVPFSMGLYTPYSTRPDRRHRRFLTWGLYSSSSCKLIDPSPKSGITQQVIKMIWTLYKGLHSKKPVEDRDILWGSSLLERLGLKLSLKTIADRTGL